jgi:hypothetical protein
MYPGLHNVLLVAFPENYPNAGIVGVACVPEIVYAAPRVIAAERQRFNTKD